MFVSASTFFRRNSTTTHCSATSRRSCYEPDCRRTRSELEITENIALDHDEKILVSLRALRKIGVGLAFDDFGTGYASLSYLTRYPLFAN